MAGVDRLYIMNCGEALVDDISTWSPGVDIGQARTFSNNCYLIRHGSDWMLWDTGVPDKWAMNKDGVDGSPGVRGFVHKTIRSQLAEIGVSPEDVSILALSHGHFDHVGNVELFTNARWLVQEIEYNAMLGPNPRQIRFMPDLYGTLRNNPVLKLNGDHDVFGDGTVRILSTPGHTPGHQSLLVRLNKHGPVILSGDVAHFSANMLFRRVPQFNFDKSASHKSMEQIQAIVDRENAELWINHDLDQSFRMHYSPKWYD
ncbi:MBL fold metallo-hydrolase [Rhizobiales bacterium RZME27]|uniref:MBL fold metallo-hydrolase n=1 Tax=Endobacterium cereale TaxID=2663029 RepID=A0A6A8A987_9HYPH|nr:N-acyl homoserine lactonase family protein [Endobacterium cereale]MQY46200.1 MBL fold metallo-hydrolase [Endobacterium cereale]